ncbi:MAG: hypothetical protein HY679_10790 [Chloroflexi bacterium]|nr:hypothetical protein [Chloroflexota bacterium]
MSAPVYQRFSLDQRAEHALTLVTFVVLAVTGLPQKYVAANWADTMIRLMGGIETTRLIHHFAAVLLMLEVVYHLVSMGYRLFVRRVRFTMLPGLSDASDAVSAFLYNLGLRKVPPQGGRYTFVEKAEYWAFIWGAVVMVITGFMMWNPIATAHLLPGQFIPAAKAAHGGEAVLAVLAIILWHLYHVHLREFNKSMFTGTMSEHEMIAEHPLELADIKAGMARPVVPPLEIKKRRQAYFPVAGVLAAVLLVGVYRFVTFEKTAIDTVQRVNSVPAYAPLTPTPLPTPRPSPTPSQAQLLPVWDGNIGLLLGQKCADCHGVIAGLDFSSYAQVMKGGTNGPVILPGNPDGSLIVEKQSKKHPGQLSDAELSVLKAWIAAGAPEK